MDFRDRLWLVGLYVGQRVRAAFRMSGITITVLAGVYSIQFSLLPWLFEKWHVPFSPLLLTFIIALVGLFPLVLLSGAIALWVADPDLYAKIVIAGRPAKEVLLVVSRHIDRVCRRTRRDVRHAEDLYQILENETLILHGALKESERRRIQRLLDRIDRFLKRLRGLIQRQHVFLQRIWVMKFLAAEELSIPQRRLCDHIFQYSPAIHRDRLLKYLGNWEALLDLTRNDSPDEERFQELVAQNRSFARNTNRRLRYQRQILRHQDLLSYVVQFASVHSTSGSLQTYAEALKFVAATGQASLRHTSENSAAWKEAKRDIADRFRFLHRKQRAHPGFDLHTLLRRILPEMSGPHDTRSPIEQVLEALDAETPLPATSPFLTVAGLEPFLTLPVEVARLVAESRKAIAKEFTKIYYAWFGKVTGSRYIVSHGYSRTVLSILKRSLPPPGTVSPELMPRLFFILDVEDKVEGDFDTRKMQYELKEDQGFRRFRNLAAGSENHLLGLLGPGDAVLVLLGAECFDGNRRVVHPRGIVRRLDSLLAELQRCEIRSLVVVVAESYKRHENSLTADTNFFGQHFDRIDLYQPNSIHLIVTNEGTIPKNWPDIVAERVQLIESQP